MIMLIVLAVLIALIQTVILARVLEVLGDILEKLSSSAPTSNGQNLTLQVERQHGICELLRRHPNGWKHEGWIREQSRAWKNAIDTPGLAVRTAGGKVEEGQR